MMTKEKSNIMQTLEMLGVKLNARENKVYKFNSNGFMPLHVETWRKKDGNLKVSLCHYGTQNGDMMRDPEVVFKVKDNKIIPLKYQNDYIGVTTRPQTIFQKNEILDLLNTWSDRIIRSNYR